MGSASVTATPDPAAILQIGFGFWPSKTLLSTVELGLFTVLGEEPLTGAQIADRLGFGSRATYDFLDGLVALRLLPWPAPPRPPSPTSRRPVAPMPTIAYGGLGHLALVTDDMDKTVRFYRDVPAGAGDTGVLPGREFCVRPLEECDAAASDGDHVSIAVGSDADLEALQERLAGIGADVSEVVDHDVARSVYVTDPNGIALEFSVAVRDFGAEPWFDDADPVPAVLQPIPGGGLQ